MNAVALGLPPHITTCLFDLDGVLTMTAKVHDAAWKETFDAFLREHAKTSGEAFVPFDANADYNTFIDGKARLDGTRSFLDSRHIDLPEGSPNDPPGTGTINGIANAKNALVVEKIAQGNVEAYPGSVDYVRRVRDAGLHRAVVSSSANCEAVLAAAGIEDLFEARVDGVTVASQHLKGKPSPDAFLAGARAIGVEPHQAAVFEDALAGVEAGRAGAFGYVVGVDRVGQRNALLAHGADIVVTDLLQLIDVS